VLVLVAMMSCGTTVLAANTADLKVIGKITPGGCTPTFVGGGTVDFGSIAASTLNKASNTYLPVKQQAYSIACSAPVKISMKFTDSRASSSAWPGDVGYFGLGFQGASTKIGGFYLQQTQLPTADGHSADQIYRDEGGTTWKKMSMSSPKNYYAKGEKHSFAAPGTLVPAAYKNYSGQYNVITALVPTNKLDLSKEVVLDGLATLEVNYL
jgi:type 1 fimbria pilin